MLKLWKKDCFFNLEYSVTNINGRGKYYFLLNLKERECNYLLIYYEIYYSYEILKYQLFYYWKYLIIFESKRKSLKFKKKKKKFKGKFFKNKILII